MADRTKHYYLALCVSATLSFMLLTMTTFSAPMSTHLYFLRSSEARGVRFGVWGWCLEEDKLCMGPMKLGYTWEPEISIPITDALVLYPISSISTFLLLVSLLPIVRTRTLEINRVVLFFATWSFLLSALAFIIMIAIFETARKRFGDAGFTSQYGPLPWMSLLATFLLGVVTILAFKLRPVEKQKSLTAKREEVRLTSPPHRRRVRPLSPEIPSTLRSP